MKANEKTNEEWLVIFDKICDSILSDIMNSIEKTGNEIKRNKETLSYLKQILIEMEIRHGNRK